MIRTVAMRRGAFTIAVALWYDEPNVRGAATPENENDRPKRLFQDHGLDLCQTVRGLASAIYLDKPA